jgi:hypothetical protein
VVAGGIISFVFYTTALEGGGVTVATAAVVLAETLPPAVIGVLFLGDSTRPGLEPVAIIGFVIAVASALTLARFGEAGQDSAGHHCDDPIARPTVVGLYPRDVLSWWPVDLRLYAVTSQTTGAPLGGSSDSVQTSHTAQAGVTAQADNTAARNDQASLRHRRRRL